MQESSRGADHGSDLCLHVSLYAGNCLEHVHTLLIGYRSGGTPGFPRNLRARTGLRAVDEEAVPASAPATSRLFVLPVVARRWVSTDNSTPPKLTVAADGSGDVFPRKLPEACMQSSSSTRVQTVGFGPHPRGATVGDCTFGSSPHPRKSSLTRLQDLRRRRISLSSGRR